MLSKLGRKPRSPNLLVENITKRVSGRIDVGGNGRRSAGGRREASVALVRLPIQNRDQERGGESQCANGDAASFSLVAFVGFDELENRESEIGGRGEGVGPSCSRGSRNCIEDGRLRLQPIGAGGATVGVGA